MKQSEEETISALKNLYANVETLREISIRDIIKPAVYSQYEQTLQEAYDALTTVEDALTSLGMKLEYEHFRLGGAVDELYGGPLCQDTKIGSNKSYSPPFQEHCVLLTGLR